MTDKSSGKFFVAELNTEMNAIKIHAGELHGISKDALFDIYYSENGRYELLQSRLSIDRALAKTSWFFLSEVASKRVTRATKVLATMTYIGNNADSAVYVLAKEALVFESLTKSTENWPSDVPRIILEKESEKYDIAVIKDMGAENSVVFELSNEHCNKLCRLPYSISLTKEVLVPLFLATGNFFYHLQRSKKEASLSLKTSIEAWKLRDTFVYSDNDSDDDGVVELIPYAKVEMVDQSIEVKVRNNNFKTKYGFAIRNTNDEPLYVWVFMFNMSDFSISMRHV
jgi:hypothetical protein